METERRLRRSWPAPGGLRLEELASIFPVGRRAHTSVRSWGRGPVDPQKKAQHQLLHSP